MEIETKNKLELKASVIVSNQTMSGNQKLDAIMSLFEELTKQIELEQWKALRFAEWTSGYCGREDFSDPNGLWYICAHDMDTFNTEELYTSKEFEQYLNGLKK